jgi:23S rRNA (pseudouridine1915-N3)-methyltransferase
LSLAPTYLNYNLQDLNGVRQKNHMLKIRFIVVDKTRAPFLREGEAFYLDRIRRYAQTEWIEVKPVKLTKGIQDEDVKGTEGHAILQKKVKGDYLIALDRTGRQYESDGIADLLKKLSIDVRGSVCFCIGGPLGLSNEVLENADSVLSLSRMTLTHEMSRIILLEQVYRAFTILNGEKYHK